MKPNLHHLVHQLEAQVQQNPRLIGIYKPTEKNAKVREMYATLGFTPLATDPAGSTRWSLDLNAFSSATVPIHTEIFTEAIA